MKNSPRSPPPRRGESETRAESQACLVECEEPPRRPPPTKSPLSGFVGEARGREACSLYLADEKRENRRVEEDEEGGREEKPLTGKSGKVSGLGEKK